MNIIRPQALLFDFDGVIVDSVPIKTEAFLELFNDYPQYAQQIKEYHEFNGGMSRYLKFDYIYNELIKRPEILTDEKKVELDHKFSQYVVSKVIALPFNPGFKTFISELKKRGVLTFVVTGTPGPEMKFICQKMELLNYFDQICGSPSSKTEIINSLFSKYNLEKEKVYFIGDAINDCEAAKNTGIHFIGYNYRDTPNVISSFLELNLV